MTDPYRVLEVGKAATDDEIKQAFRRLAKRYHPDLNKGDAKAEEKFKAVSTAFEILGDPQRRKRFDLGEIDEQGREQGRRGARTARRRSSGFRFSDLGDTDIFGDIFGARGRQGGGDTRDRGSAGGGPGRGAGIGISGTDTRYEVTIDFLEAMNGARKRVEMMSGASLEVSIPAGIQETQVLRLKGKGLAGMGGGTAGDALVTVRVRPHASFRRDGNDIRSDLAISLPEAVLGAEVTAPTISGTVKLRIPAGANTGTVLRVRGKGVPAVSANAEPGDHYVTLKVVLPKTIDPDLEKFVRGWAAKNAYDPR